jgi:hypothetical protein
MGNNYAQEKKKNFIYFIYPQKFEAAHFKHCLSIYAAKLPEDVVEEASNWIFAPVFAYDLKFGISENFALTGGVKSNIITHHFSLGARWIHRWNKFAVALGYDGAYFFGYLDNFGFESKINGWFTYPNLTIGYQFTGFTLAIRMEAHILMALNETIDDLKINHDIGKYIGKYDGVSLGFYIEQPFWKRAVVVLGMKFTVSRFYYPAWMAFTRFDRPLLIPETFLGFNL